MYSLDCSDRQRRANASMSTSASLILSSFLPVAALFLPGFRFVSPGMLHSFVVGGRVIVPDSRFRGLATTSGTGIAAITSFRFWHCQILGANLSNSGDNY